VGITAPSTAPTRATDAPRGLADALWLALAALGFAALCALSWRFVADDAWITARYADNLAAGDGFVWNPGGPRVEGYSNPALVGLEALGARAGIAPIDFARWFGVACGLALLVVVDRLGREVVGAAAARVALVLIALYAPFAMWSVGGLETPAVALALTAGVLLACLRRPVAAGAALAALPWLRPEGLAAALAVAVAAEAPGLLRRADRRAALRGLAAAAGLPLLSQAVLEALRLAIYGHWLPNSVLYKTGDGHETFSVLRRFLVEGAGSLLLVGAACGLLVARGRARLLAVPFLVYAIGSLGTRDSVNSFSRFFLPLWPQLALLAALAVVVAYRRAPRVPAIVVTGAVALVGVQAAVDAGRDVREFADGYASCPQAARVDAARWLRGNTPPGARFAISDAGLVPAQAGRTAYDQLGLNEPGIQVHGPLQAPQRSRLSLARRPDVLVVLSRTAPERSVPYRVDWLVTRHSGFRDYRLAHVARGGGEGCRYHLFLYRRAA
jgi:hypothetical protein